MHTIRYLLVTACALGGLCLLPGTARAAQSYDNCTGFIDSVPATISTAGVWCLRKNVSTANTSGNAITISANNVTIDCNDFKIGGLAAGNASQANGIYSSSRQNVTVRHCNVRGFLRGISLNGGAGHLVEDNRLDNNLRTGISVSGDNNRVRRNAVYDTSGYGGSGAMTGILAAADIIDNTVAGVVATATATDTVWGIYASAPGSEIRGNQVRGLALTGSGFVFGIVVTRSGLTVAGNRISATTMTKGLGIDGAGADTFCTGNTVVNFTTAYHSCEYSFGNLPAP
ncbi:right-handed parallel beta-helix repeat-containing protein [Luteimonas mephitis]|uniref:right-handed parallel beta-helix repeat-containing protein n=1 Tax=Luteimonas mephitis TaxID=83615 RepID=UPI0004150E4F|nr:right-handed parallel beta-helix repeat-containing protein [Luteimonas mephitis]